MRLLDQAIDKPRLIFLGAILLCAAGIAAVVALPKERTPRVKLPVISVIVPNPGAPASVNESQIVRRIEEESATLKGLRDDRSVLSQSIHGAAGVQFVFDHSVNVTEAKRDVESMINRIKSEFPREAQQNPGPIVSDIGYDHWPVIQVFIAGGKDGTQRRRIAERLQTELEPVKGVAGVDIFGGLEREIQIEVDPNLMVLYGFSYQQLELAVRKANTETPSGSIESRGNDQRVRTRGRIETLDDLGALPVGASDGKPILLSDVAGVTMGHKPLASMARYGGQDAVVLLVRAKTDIDMLATANAAQAAVDRFIAQGSAEDTKIGTVRSQAREIHYMIEQLGSNALYGTLLVIVMLWFSFGWRNATLIAISFPFCILGTAAFLWLAKVTINPDLAINNMTLFAIIVVVGEVADGAIIVGENIYRHRELGKSPREAARHGLREVGAPLMSAYLTTVAGFAPLLFIRGIMGDFLELMPIVTIFALCAAVLVAYLLLPTMSVYLMAQPKKIIKAPQRADGTLMSEDEQMIADADALVAASPLKRWYEQLFNFCFRHRVAVLALSIIVMVVPVGLYATGAVGFEFMPEGDQPVIEVYFELPLGSSMERKSVAVAERIEQAVMRAVKPDEWYRPSESAERARPVTTIGDPGALNIRLDVSHGTGPEFGMVYVELERGDYRNRTNAQIRKAISDELPALPGVIVQITSPSEGPPAGSPVVVRVLGQKETPLEVLADRAAKVEELLRGVPGVYDVTSDYRTRSELVVDPDRAVASLFDVDSTQISSAVNYALEGVLIGEVDLGGDERIDMRLRNLPGSRDQVTDLSNLSMRSATGKVLTLGEVASITRTQTANTIQHHDRKRAISVRAEVMDGVLPDQVKAALVTVMRPDLSADQQNALINAAGKAIAVDDDVVVEFGGENEIRDEAAEDMTMALTAAMVLMLIILVVQFNSFIQPLIILSSVPLCLVGVAVGLMLFNLNFSIMAMIGIVALSGVVVDNAMVMVEFINSMRHMGIPLRKAMVYSGQFRVRPLLLTTLTNIVGMLPVALNWGGGAEIWQPLAVTIIFGMGFATVLQLFVVPLMVYCFDFSAHRDAPKATTPAPRVDDDDAEPGVAPAL
jgi:HAE1 family hydrophobic/amphiphilic exporter-1